jgi:DNA-binding MarR family transcriptional regulator
MPRSSETPTLDYVDQMLEDWGRERPDLDLSPLGIFGRISRVSRRLDSDFSKMFRAHGMTTWAFYVLAALARSGPPYEMTPTDLYRSLLVSSGVMTNRIARLERLGFVKRVPDPADGRGVRVALMREGREAVNVAIEHHNLNEHQMLAILSSEERRAMASSLRKLLLQAGDRPNVRRGAGAGPFLGSPPSKPR